MQSALLVLIVVLLIFAAFPNGLNFKEGFFNYLHMSPVDVGTNGPYLQRLADYRTTKLVTQPDYVFNPYNSRIQGPQYNYPNLTLPSQVVGCGGRRGGCLGGSQMVIPNVPSPKDISNTNIAPVTVATRWDPNNPQQQPHQVGVIYKVFGDSNDIYPLYGAKRYFNCDLWDYYTIVQKAGGIANKIPVRTKNNNQRLGNNDPVWLPMISNCNDEYRVTIYENDIQYNPYL